MERYDTTLLNNKIRSEKITILEHWREKLFQSYTSTAKEWFAAFTELREIYKGISDIRIYEAYEYVVYNSNWTAIDYYDYIICLPDTQRYNQLRQVAVSKLEYILPHTESFEAYTIYANLVHKKIKGLDVSKLDKFRKFNLGQDVIEWYSKITYINVYSAPRFHKIWVETRSENEVNNMTTTELFGAVTHRFLADYDSEDQIREYIAKRPKDIMDAFRLASSNDINVMDKDLNLVGIFTQEESDFNQMFQALALSRAIGYRDSLFNQVGFWSAYFFIIKNSNFTSVEEQGRLGEAANYYKKGEYGSACFYLLTTIESSLRRNLNLSVSSSSEGNLFDEKQLGDLLTHLSTQTENTQLVGYLRNILVSKKGLNLRNKILHGMSFDLEDSKSAVLLFHVIWLLSIARKNKNSQYIFPLYYANWSRIDSIIYNSEPGGNIGNDT
jgi:hypothetical protein